MSDVASLQQRLNNHLMRWDGDIKEFDKAISEYGERKADLEYKRAYLKEVAKSENPKLSGVALDQIADANEAVWRLHKLYRQAESNIEAFRARLKWCQAVSDALRTEISSERSNSQMYADHPASA